MYGQTQSFVPGSFEDEKYAAPAPASGPRLQDALDFAHSRMEELYKSVAILSEKLAPIYVPFPEVGGSDKEARTSDYSALMSSASNLIKRIEQINSFVNIITRGVQL